jgi:hypothetical protein
LDWPEIAQTASAAIVTFFVALLVAAVLARVKPISDRLVARMAKIERQLAEKERRRRLVAAERVEGGDE